MAVTTPEERLPPASASIVIIEPDPRLQQYLFRVLKNHFRNIVAFGAGEEGLVYLRAARHPQVVIASNNLADLGSAELLSSLRKLPCRTYIAMMAHVHEYAVLLPLFRGGTEQILLKPFGAQEVLEVLSGLGWDEDAGLVTAAHEVALGSGSFVFSSAAMCEIREQAALVARVNVPVLILGETGTGKEVLAQYIHGMSPQAELPFLKVNCAAVPSELLESELFGYDRGAFTGANRPKPGKFQLCKNGTMFLDEIGEMSPRLQAKLLQVLQDGTFTPLGSGGMEKVNVRIIAATNVDIEAAISQKLFREDLYYRLSGICLRLPPLRERQDEIPLLLEHFLRKYSKQLALKEPAVASARLRRACLNYDWPGNLRELENFVIRYLALGDERLRIGELRKDGATSKSGTLAITREAIAEALNACGGHRRKAAQFLGISYKVLLRRLRKLELDSPPTVHEFSPAQAGALDGEAEYDQR